MHNESAIGLVETY